MASYADLIKKLGEYQENIAASITEKEIPKNFSEFLEEIEEFDSDSLSGKYLKENSSRGRSVFKEFLDGFAGIKRASDSRNKSRIDFMLEEANNMRAIAARAQAKNIALGDASGQNFGG